MLRRPLPSQAGQVADTVVTAMAADTVWASADWDLALDTLALHIQDTWAVGRLIRCSVCTPICRIQASVTAHSDTPTTARQRWFTRPLTAAADIHTAAAPGMV